MLQAFALSYEHGPLFGPIFQNVSLSLGDGEKVGLVGPNGCGKSTLLSLLAGETPLQSGRIVAPERVVLLRQDFDFHFEGTTLDAIFSRLEPDVLESEVRRAASKLGVHSALLDQPYATLSLGERMRAALVAVLCADPDVLLLDEPTNHLDLEGRRWLKGFLLSCRPAVLMVCHDRTMLDAVVTRTLELSRGTLTEYTGGYTDMIEAKAGNLKRQMAEYESERDEIRRLKNASEKTLQKAGKLTRVPTRRTWDPAAKPFYAARQKSVDKRAKAIQHRSETLQQHSVEKPFVADDPKLEFPMAPLYGDVLSVRNLSKGYDKPLFEDLSFDLESGDRVALLGPNGSGKTTLLRILLAEEHPDEGEVRIGSKVRIGYLTQGRQKLPTNQTLISALAPRDRDEETVARTLLGRLGLSGDAVTKHVGDLSVGERTKSEIVRLLMAGANLLILDEPTNHLDIESLEALERALLAFPGAILFTSHDRAFVERVANREISLG